MKFSECGEWGGHEEKILITTKSDEKFYLSYRKSTVDCDSMVLVLESIEDYYGAFQQIIDSCCFEMNSNHKNSIYNFSLKLLSAKFSEEIAIYTGVKL